MLLYYEVTRTDALQCGFERFLRFAVINCAVWCGAVQMNRAGLYPRRGSQSSEAVDFRSPGG